jgi:hypothetical protein
MSRVAMLIGWLKPFGSSIANGAFGRFAVIASVTAGVMPVAVRPPQTFGSVASVEPSRSFCTEFAAVAFCRPFAPGKLPYRLSKLRFSA